VRASALYLTHLAEAWDRRFPGAPLAEQVVVLTVPASFDEVARELTVRAAKEAGLGRVRLVEEPQAAFYDWTAKHRGKLEAALAGARLVLVCDVGGGTTDFTLIHASVGRAGAGAAAHRRRRPHPAGGDNRTPAGAPGGGAWAPVSTRAVDQLCGLPAGKNAPRRRRADKTRSRSSGAQAARRRGAERQVSRGEGPRRRPRRLLPRTLPTELPQKRRAAPPDERGLHYASDRRSPSTRPRTCAGTAGDRGRAGLSSRGCRARTRCAQRRRLRPP
jgi:hypothetical protein